MSAFLPYENESQVLQIGNLNIENRLDKVSLFGEIDITADEEGLKNAKELATLVNSIIYKLEGRKLSERILQEPTVIVNNPFLA